MDELLTINVGQKAAHVEVRYVLKNQTDKKTKVRIEFPVEQLTDDRDNIEFDPESEEQETKKKKPTTTPVDCRNYSVELAGKKCPRSLRASPSHRMSASLAFEAGSFPRCRSRRKGSG